jgi:flagellar biosynthesis protein FliR
VIIDERHLLAAFVAFCRIGACLGIAPGFSSPRIPMRIRLAVSLGFSAAFSPLLFADEKALPKIETTADLALAIGSQIFVGALLGLTSRLLISALETLMTALSMAIGVTSTFAGRVDDSETLPGLASFIVFSATVLIFLTDSHWSIIRALIESFETFPLSARLGSELALSHILKTLAFAFPLALRIAMPFMILGVLVNVAFALINRAAPQIAMYFISVPFAMAAGFLLLYLTWNDLLRIFIAGLSFWLSKA